MIQLAFVQLGAIDEMLADLLNAGADGEIVVAGRATIRLAQVMAPSGFTL